jgi:thioredoxin-related protein
MTTRRDLLLGVGSATGAALAARVLRPSPAFADPVLNDDGLYSEPWFLESFLDLREDIADAGKDGKRLAIMWELKGCPYCRETHLVNFARPDIVDYVKNNFSVLQLNIIGSRKVTDVDGTEVGEKAFAGRYGVRFTPTFQFFPDSVEGLAARPAEKREVARMAGYLRPDDFLAMFRFVREKHYETQTFRDYLKSLPS